MFLKYSVNIMDGFVFIDTFTEKRKDRKKIGDRPFEFC